MVIQLGTEEINKYIKLNKRTTRNMYHMDILYKYTG